MKINKSLNIDLNIISPQKHIRIHEGDVDSVDILIGVTVDDESVDLDGVTIKYDATINNYLAEQDANGSVVNGKISIPVTQNMTAMSGLLLIDVRMIQNDQILFTQTICATVEKAVVNGSTYIDFDKITIIQRMNALEDKMDYIEELVENFDTSKLIVSVNRPPMGAPVEVDVDLLRVGDTWILSGANIVYKLVEAQYNYQPVPSAEPYHKFTWQPLNERYGVGNTEPPISATYQTVVYTINEVQWSWLPVPEYFKGDHYQMQVGVDDPTYYICVSGNMAGAGVCNYRWREEGGSVDAYTKAETNALLADKMDLAPLNPTAEEIAAMPSGQLYGDTVNHKGTIKDGQSFYDTVYIDKNYRKAYTSVYNPPIFVPNNAQDTLEDSIFKTGDRWINSSAGVGTGVYVLRKITLSPNRFEYKWVPEYEIWYRNTSGAVPSVQSINEVQYQQGVRGWYETPHYLEGVVLYEASAELGGTIQKVYKCYATRVSGYQLLTYWAEVSVPENYYTKTEINTMIGDIGTAIDTLNDNIDTLNTNLSEV